MKLERINYKIDLSWVRGKAREAISEAVQKKAFSLGFVWEMCDTTFRHTGSPYLYFDFLVLSIHFGCDKCLFNDKSDFTEIPVNDWLNCDGFKESVKSPDTEHESGVDFDFDNYKPGKTIKYKGKKYEIIAGCGCQGCSFYGENCASHNFCCDHIKFREIK